MNIKWACVGAMTTLIMGPWNFGMAEDGYVVRAQNGVVYPEQQYVYEGEVYDDCDDGHCSPFGHFRRCFTYVTTLGGRPGAGYVNRDPRQLDYQYLYRYKAPKNLRYPPANQPAGVVVYPYYTVKGPDDFFLNETLGN